MSTNEKIALVTGASSGIGKAISEFLAEKGFYVYAAARSMNKLEAMRSENLEPLLMDVTDEESVGRGITQIEESKGRLDILVNNAGYGLYGSVEGLSQEHIQAAFNVNVFGLGNVTRAVLPIMRGQSSGTIVNVSSVVGKVSMPFLAWYASSKHAVEGLTDGLRNEVRPFGIKVVLIEPGSINTGFEDVAMATLEKSKDPEVYSHMREKFAGLIRSGYKTAPGPEIVAKAIYKAITTSNPKPRYAVGKDGKMYIRMKGFLSDKMFDGMLAGQFK